MLGIHYTVICILGLLQGGTGLQSSSQIDKIFAIIINEYKGCDVSILPDTIDWCNGTLNTFNLLPDFTACQAEDELDTYLLCRNGLWWNGETRFRHTGRSKRSAISAVVAREKQYTCTWLCAPAVSDAFGKKPPTYEFCPNSTILYPVGNSTQVTHEWQYPVVTDLDGNITSFEQILGPTSPSMFQASKSPGNMYHISYMAEDDDRLKWPCSFIINAEIPVCPAIVSFANGEYSCDNETNRGSKCEFRCNEGYYLNTTNTTVCQDDGKWSFGEAIPECLPLRCGEISFNSSEVEFQCYDNSDEFGTVCWARCSYGYILRNDLQEEEQQAALAEIAETAAEDLENAETAKLVAEDLVEQATENVVQAEEDTTKALAVNASTVTKLITLESEIQQIATNYNNTLILAEQTMSDAQEAMDNRSFEIANNLLAQALNLTTEAEELNTRSIEAKNELENATQDALQAGVDATEAVNKLAAAKMYLNETEINLEIKTDEVSTALAALNEATEKLNAAKLYAGLEDKMINSYAKCSAEGTWVIQGEPYCIDTEPPLLKCVPIYSLYLGPGQSIINGNWPRPSIMEDATGTAEVYQVSGPAEGSALAAGQHVVKYVARDASDNVSPMCTILINVEERWCDSPATELTDENVVFDCESYNAGSTCFLSCLNNYELDGNDMVDCIDYTRTGKVDYKWNLENTSCIVEDCPILPDPFDGNITCENTTDGDTCTITCNEGYRLPYKFAHVYHCGDTGSWFPSVQPIACIENDDLQVAVYTLTISYLSSNECYQFELEDQQIAIETALKSYLQTFQACEEDYECMMGTTSIDCQEDEEVVKFTLNIITTCPDNTESSCDLTFVIMDAFENDIRYSIEDVGVLDHLNLTLADDWLNTVSVDIPTCLEGSVLIGAYCEKCGTGTYMDTASDTCRPCPLDTYSDTPGLSACKPCPVDTHTITTGGTSASDCKGLCSPGSYSETTTVPCLKCKTGTYQTNYGQANCTKCPDGTWTTISGAVSEEMCIVFDMYFDKDLPSQEVAIGEILQGISAIFWIKGFDIPILTLGLFYDDTDFAFQLVTEENIQLFTDGWDNMPTNVRMTSNEWNMLAIVWNMFTKEIKLYKNGDLAFNMKTKDSTVNPTKVFLSVKEETFLSSFVIFPYIIFPQIISTAYSDCRTILPGLNVLTMLASLRLDFLKPVPSTCRASNVTEHDNCGNHDCQNDGVCQHSDTIGYTCNCTEEYGGHFCEVKLVHGNWSDWINATECSVTCGVGVRGIYRLCNNPSPGLYGDDCVGNSTELVECMMEDCQECQDISINSGTVCILEDEECIPTCEDGRIIPKGQYGQKFRCGVSTNYEWVPLNRLPLCARVSRPSSYEIAATFDVTPSIPCEHLNTMSGSYDSRIAGLICPSQNENCVSSVKLEGCVESTVLEIKFQVTLTSGGRFDLEEYFATRNITDSILETVTAIEDLELTLKEVLSEPDKLNIVFDNVTYAIIPESAAIIARTLCMPGFIDTQGVCVQCQPGTSVQSGWCVYCDKGTYQDSLGQSDCTLCPAGKTTDIVGARSVDECIDIITEPTPPADITGIIIAVSAVLGIIAVVLIVLVALKFYITHKRRRQFDMEAETTSLFTEFPDIAYNMYFKKKQFLGFDESGFPIIAHTGIEGDDKKRLLYDEEYPFKTDEVFPTSVPPLEPFSFSARPINDNPFDHPPPQLKKKSFVKPTIDPIKHFNFPQMREMPVRFKVPKRKRFQNKFPRHTFGLEDEDTGYISKKIPIPKNATKLLYKSPTGENLYAYLFKDGTIGTMSPRSTADGVEPPDLSLLKAQYLGEDGEFQHPPPVFEKNKVDVKHKTKPIKKTALSLRGNQTFEDRFDSRPSTAKTLSRPSTAKTLSRPSTAKTLSRPSTTKSRGRSSTSARSNADSQLDSFRSTSSTGSPRPKSAFLRSGHRSVKSVSIKENADAKHSPRGKRASRPKSAADSWMLEVAETYRPKSIGNVLDAVESHPISVLQPGSPVPTPRGMANGQKSDESIPLKDQKMKLISPPFGKSPPKSVSPVVEQNGSKEHMGSDDNLDKDEDAYQKEVHFENDINETDADLHSDSSESITYTRHKDHVKRHSHASSTFTNGSPAPKPVIPKGMKVLRTAKGFVENLNLPVPPRSHQIKAVSPPPQFLQTKDQTEVLQNDNE